MKKVKDGIQKLVWKFLKKHGGLANGYATWVSGTVESGIEHNIGCHLDWSTPVVDDITGNMKRQLGNKLHDEIAQYLTENKVSQILTFTEVYVEDGCHETSISFSESYRLFWWDEATPGQVR
jgi:hypothetical protein